MTTFCATTHFNAKGEPIPCPGSHATTAAERIAELKARVEQAEAAVERVRARAESIRRGIELGGLPDTGEQIKQEILAALDGEA